MNKNIRTDLALEAEEIWRESAGETTTLSGVIARDKKNKNFKVTTVKIIDGEGEAALGKPQGSYITIELDRLIRREENAFHDAVTVLADELSEMMQLKEDAKVLIAGLGNISITPDAVGPESIQCIMVTRHLKERVPEYFSAFRDVTAIQTGVLGTTGMESADLIMALKDKINPDYVIAIDALASRKMERLCRTLQLADTGIIPGSGVGNSRAALNRDTLGIPVIAIGVPTVVDAGTLAADLLEDSGVSGVDPKQLGENANMIVTPRDIDKNVKDIGKLIGYGINMALHEGLTMEDIDMFIS